MNNTRRHFFRGMALSGLAILCNPSLAVTASAEKKKKLKMAKGSVILFQGDSITDGNRGRDADPNHIMGHGYQFTVASRWGAEYPEKELKFYNRGISGNKVIDLAARWQGDTLELKPTILSILVGVNDSTSVIHDWKPVVPVEKYEEVYRQLLDQTKAALPEVLLVLCEPFIVPVGNVKNNWDRYYADIAKRQSVVRKLVQEYDAVFVPFQEVFDNAIKKAPASYWIWDGVHPTVAGHELMAREWIKQVGKRIEL
ncbi:MAG TPA: SGNH/GDSL hydrolase family protein [Prolixibacteraceae bacterium]|nr:SGNH/GDSL hydrolase family protein [Prolixibacteraceae bacterium]